MQIRSVTVGIEASAGDPTAAARVAREFLRVARPAFTAVGLPPQSTRLSTQPAHLFLTPHQLLPFGRAFDAACVEAEADYYATGAIVLGGAWTAEATAEAVASAIIGTQRLFTSIQLLREHAPLPNPGREQTIDFAALRAAANIIARVARETPNGFGNLRFAGAANVPSNTPFFPVAYHQGGPPAFSIALQAADLAVQAFGGDDALEDAQARLIARIASERQLIDRIARDLERTTGVRYVGLDLSLAPFPSPEESIGTALEALGLDRLGAPGSLAAAALLTQALRNANDRPGAPQQALTPPLSQGERESALTPALTPPLSQGERESALTPALTPPLSQGERESALTRAPSTQTVGFSGLMLPVLEDAVLAQRASEGSLALSDLLVYSAVCGTGLDTVPLPGDLSEEAIASILLDVAALSRALAKPLTARLFPVPGKVAGDLTEFDFPFFANARVLPVRPFTAGRLIQRGLVLNHGSFDRSVGATLASPAGQASLTPTVRSALTEAQQLQADAAELGFDWPDVSGVIDKLHEEVAELAAARNGAEREDELGDLMFSLVNLARWFGLSAEDVMQRANAKFTRRFGQVLAACQQQGRRPQDFTLAELESLWQEAKNEGGRMKLS